MDADCQSTIEFAQIVVRGLLLALVSVGGMISIYFGWRLYQAAILSKVEGEYSGPNLKFKLSAASPGVFLAAFGAYLLLSVAQHRWIETETREEPLARPSALTAAPWSFVQRVQHRAEASLPSCNCPPKQECLLAKSTKGKVWIGGTSEVTDTSLNEDLTSIRVVLERVTPVDRAERTRHLKATQALARLEAAAAEASGERK